MTRKEHHVVPNPSGDWNFRSNNAICSSGYFNKKEENVNAGIKTSQIQVGGIIDE